MFISGYNLPSMQTEDEWYEDNMSVGSLFWCTRTSKFSNCCIDFSLDVYPLFKPYTIKVGVT